MREEKEKGASAGCIFRRGLRGHRDHHGTGAQGARSADILGPLAFMAHGHQLCGKLPVHRNYLDKPPLPDAVGRSADAATDLDQLRPSLHDIALALCDRVGCAHQTRVVTCSVLRRAVRVH